MNATSNTLLLYRNVTVLSREAHRNLRLKPVEGFAFAKATHLLPVAGVEFFQAARTYPIVFASETVGGKEEINPVLLVGLEPGHNEYISSAMRWKEGTYVPAFVRRYPFVAAETPGRPDELTICFDGDFEGFSQTEGAVLFNEDGSAGAMLDSAMRFMNDFARDMKRNRRFVEQLVWLDLLDKRSLTIRSASGNLFNLPECLVVGEDRLARLKAADLAALNEEGFLGWIFAHLISLGNLPNLFALYLARKAS